MKLPEPRRINGKSTTIADRYLLTLIPVASHMPNLVQELNACEVRRLTQMKFDNAISAASVTDPVKYSTEVRQLFHTSNFMC